MKTLPAPVLRLCGLLLGLVLAAAALSPPAVAAATVAVSATITNTDGVAQDGSVCVQLVGSQGCIGDDSLVGGNWSMTWDGAIDQAGDYLIEVGSDTMDGASRWYVAGDPAGTPDIDLATAVHLDAGAADVHFTMVMPAIAKVSGKVVDAGNHGRPGLRVTIDQNGATRSTFTGAGGVYDLGYTSARAASATVSVEGGLYFLDTRRSVVVPASGSLVVPDLVVQGAAIVSGQVTDAVTGDPVPFVEVTAYTAGGSPAYVNAATTDVSGRYAIGGLGTTSILLRFKDPYQGYQVTLNNDGDPVDWSPQTPIDVTQGERRGYDQALVPVTPGPVPPHTLSGAVTDTLGHPLVGIQVTAKKGATAVTAETNRLGRWYLVVADGDYTLAFSQGWRWQPSFGSEAGWAPETFPGRMVSAEPTPVTVSGGVAVDGLDVKLGRALANVTAPSISGVLAPGHTVSAEVGGWSVRTGTTFTTTWLRDGVEVGTGSSYAVRPADIGHTLRIRVAATHGLTEAEALSSPREVGKLDSSVVVSGKSPKPGRVKLVVSVRATGLTPTGTLTVNRGVKVVARDVAVVDGRAVVRLRRQPSGARRYTVSYGGSAQTLPGASTVKVRVR